MKAAFQKFSPGHPLLKKYLSYSVQAPYLYAESAFEIACRTDDPAVVYACMRHLLNHESDLLILLALDMIRDARLAEMDAVEILGQNPLWALPILNEDLSDTAGCLIAGLLPKIPQDETIQPKILEDWMLRALPYVEDEDTRIRYLSYLLTSGRTESFQVDDAIGPQ